MKDQVGNVNASIHLFTPKHAAALPVCFGNRSNQECTLRTKGSKVDSYINTEAVYRFTCFIKNGVLLSHNFLPFHISLSIEGKHVIRVVHSVPVGCRGWLCTLECTFWSKEVSIVSGLLRKSYWEQMADSYDCDQNTLQRGRRKSTLVLWPRKFGKENIVAKKEKKKNTKQVMKLVKPARPCTKV